MDILDKIDQKYPNLYTTLAIGYGLLAIGLAILHFQAIITLPSRFIEGATLFSLGIAIMFMAKVQKNS